VIVGERGDRLVIVRQVDHQEQCAAMADAWGNERFSRPAPFAPIRLAAAIHDEGWREWEAAPRVAADGRPVDFPELDRASHIALYTHGIEAACRRGDATGLLVSMHGTGLYTKRMGLDGPSPPVETRPLRERGFLEEERARQWRLAARLGIALLDAGWPWAAYRLLQAWDQLSLYLVWRGLSGGADGRLLRVPRDADDREGVDIGLRAVDRDTCIATPFPFAGDQVVLEVATREIPNRPYDGDGDLARELARSEPISLRPRVVRAPSAPDAAPPDSAG
jgi:hypothetical protein